MNGTISHLSDKGFGFIKVEGHDKGLFFHASAVKNCPFEELSKGDKVTISNIIDNEKGSSARGVNVVYE